MSTRRLGSTKATDLVLITSVNLATEVTGSLPLANIGNITTARLVGRSTAGSGVAEEISIGTGLSLSAGVLSATSVGTVNSGTANQLAYYAGTGTAVSGLTSANSGVLVTSGAGVPSISTDIPTAVTIGTAYIYRVGGTDVAVTDGGTGLSAGTSGGILGFTGSTTIASSVALTASAIVLGGGAGATPTPMASLGTTSTVLHGNAGGAPTFGAVVAADIGSAIAVLFGQVTWGTAGAETANVIEIQGTVGDIAGTAIAAATSEVEVCCTDSATDAEPSATATIAAAGTPVGTLLSGTGTATITIRTNASGLFSLAITETAAADRFLWVRQGRNSQCWIRSASSPKSLTFA